MNQFEQEQDVREVVEQGERSAAENIRELVRNQREVWQLIPMMVHHAEENGIRLDQATRFRRKWEPTTLARVNHPFTDTGREYDCDFWYVGRSGQGRIGSLGVACETGEFVSVRSDGTTTDISDHRILDAARNYPQALDAVTAVTQLAKAVSDRLSFQKG